MTDPVNTLWEYLSSLPDLPKGSVTGDLVGREAGETTVYLNESGGHRLVRDRMDRADIEYDVYAEDRAEAKRLALLVRRHLLEELPGREVAGALVLDVDEISRPRYYPDSVSREHMYGGEIAVFFVEA
ncbi:hypothetical protein [Kitasatospora sp. MBT66]|uniref:hypothetical protein n=1 Tax=Kitasatospora sp. MBT66 TaxID=1444769 RepID=UPI0005BBAFBF|nr:hypothetical protein [Kitasatospora sp. MBT66]